MRAQAKQKTANKKAGPKTPKPTETKKAVPSGPSFGGLNWLVNAWIFIPALIYFVLVTQYAVNVPMKDDYDAILNFLNSYSHTPSFFHKLGLLFAQHNEHRIFSTRLITVLYYSIFGNVNFRNLILIGNLQLMVIFLISVYFIRRCLPKYRNIVSFIWGLCLFDPSGYENGDVAMTSLQNFGIVMLFLASIFFYSRDPKRNLVPAALFQLVCIFSSGNGIPGAFIIMLFTLFSRDKWKIIVSTAILLFFSPLYFYHYIRPAPLPGVEQGISAGTAIPYFLKMCGAHFSFENSLLFGIVVLVVLLLTLPFDRKTLVKRPALPLVCLAAFLLVTVGVISLLRSGSQPFYASRYLIYTHLLAAIAILFVFMKLPDIKKLWPVAVIFSAGMIYAYSGNYRYGKSGFIRENLRLETLDYYYPDRERAKTIAAEACQSGIYCIQDEK